MLLMRAIVRPEKKDEVLAELSSAGFPAATVVDVVGRGKQKGIKIGNMVYDEIQKSLIMVAIHDEEKENFIDVVSGRQRPVKMVPLVMERSLLPILTRYILSPEADAAFNSGESA